MAFKVNLPPPLPASPHKKGLNKDEYLFLYISTPFIVILSLFEEQLIFLRLWIYTWHWRIFLIQNFEWTDHDEVWDVILTYDEVWDWNVTYDEVGEGFKHTTNHFLTYDTEQIRCLDQALW